jgi:DNA-directed RNA polymerase subunit RPC12/RpoP
MGLNLTCPQCGKRMTLDFSTSKVSCPHCGYVRPDEIAHLEDVTRQAKAQGERPAVDITYHGEIMPSALAAFETGQDWLFKGDRQQALQAFRRSADFQPDFVDAHLWIAKVSDDPGVKREHLDTVLVHDPTHLEALRMLMVLNGRLTPEQAARTHHDDDQQVRQAADPVTARATELLCPTCGGDLTVNDGAQRVECRFCGYSRPQESLDTGHVHEDLLSMALLARKATPVRWNVGKRLVKCQQCGAEHTIPAERMSQRCRFCGSNQVIVSDALASFEQPDGLIPFTITPDDAMERIRQQLHSLGERILGFFDSNRVERSTVEGVYLPFWAFDATVAVTETRTIGTVSSNSSGMEFVDDIAVCAVKSPPPALTVHLNPYDLAAVLPYEPKWLAKVPAQLYSVDFDAASLEARAAISRSLKAKHERQIAEARLANQYRSFEAKETVQFTNNVQSMSFQLLLLPVWIATLVEEDGDVRIAVVNGQTGKAALGKAEKRRK